MALHPEQRTNPRPFHIPRTRSISMPHLLIATECTVGVGPTVCGDAATDPRLMAQVEAKLVHQQGSTFQVRYALAASRWCASLSHLSVSLSLSHGRSLSRPGPRALSLTSWRRSAGPSSPPRAQGRPASGPCTSRPTWLPTPYSPHDPRFFPHTLRAPPPRPPIVMFEPRRCFSEPIPSIVPCELRVAADQSLLRPSGACRACR
jgi:hypothetical protein